MISLRTWKMLLLLGTANFIDLQDAKVSPINEYRGPHRYARQLEDEGSGIDLPAKTDAKLHPEFLMRPITQAQCRDLKTSNCELQPGTTNCAKGNGLFARCSEEAGLAEIEYFLTKIQKLDASRGLDLELKGVRDFKEETFVPVTEVLISMSISNYDKFNFDNLGSLKLPWLTHLGVINCSGVIVGENAFKPFPLLTMIIFSRSPIESIHPGAFDGLKHLMQLSLDMGLGSPSQMALPSTKRHLRMLHCDCEYVWLRNFLRTKPYLIAAREEGEIHAWGGIISHKTAARQNALAIDCRKPNLLGSPDQKEFSINTNC